ncbi:MAG: DUF4760 domain-containing protein [Terriglobales bacterium]
MAKSAGKKATAADADIVMKLYDLRREAEMRKARNWFASWSPQSFDEITQLSMNFAADENRWMRQVLTYWENAASLVLRGVVNRDLFLDWGGELIFVYTKIKPWLKQIREFNNMPDWLEKVEKVATSTPETRKRVAWMEDRFKKMAEMRARTAKA